MIEKKVANGMLRLRNAGSRCIECRLPLWLLFLWKSEIQLNNGTAFETNVEIVWKYIDVGIQWFANVFVHFYKHISFTIETLYEHYHDGGMFNDFENIHKNYNTFVTSIWFCESHKSI